MSGRFGSVVTAMVTPFDEAGALDVDAAVTLARWLVDHGTDGLVLAGTTGEGPTLDDDEKCELWRAVASAVTVPVVAGAGSNDTRHSMDMARRAESCGVAGLLVVTPYYNRPSQAGLASHFGAVAGATGLPILIYDIPVRAGRRVHPDTLLDLARRHPTIVGVKDAANDPPSSARVVAEAPAGFELYSGSDDYTLALLALGAVGAVSVASHWSGELHADMLAAFAKGDVDEARRINALLVPSYVFEGSEDAPNPVPTKCLLRQLGLRVGRCRLPMDAEPDDLGERAAAVLAGLGAAAPRPVVA